MAKIYATSRNSKTSKGIGDNDMITIDLNHGNKRIAVLRYTIGKTPIKDEPYLDINIDGVWYEIALQR